MQSELREFLNSIGEHDWEAGIYGDTVICPCGNELELDADECFCGRKNPLGGWI